jgi:eukaryotic-like serine/threonine-protein kinase
MHESKHKLLVGRPAPPFDVSAVSFDSREDRRVTLTSYTGRWLLLLFYPHDFSFVCPTELTAFSAHIDSFHSRDCEILGVSVDSIKDHIRWFDTATDRGGIGPLQFPLASDPEGIVSSAYGIWMEEHSCSARALFIIDPAGTVQYSVVHSASIGRSTEETLRVLEALQSGGLCPASWTSADGTIDAEAQLQTGRVLGHYRIVEKLGVGVFGSVLAADDLRLGRRVAIKVIRQTANAARDEVFREARAAAGLHHPNICTVFAVDTIDAVPVIVMEHIEGRPLADLDISALDADTRKQILLGIASGLASAHAGDVVHGDLKPANIMITNDWQAKLLDFGLAIRGAAGAIDEMDGSTEFEETSDLADTIIGDVTDSKGRFSLRGTPAYMSPEQTRGLPARSSSDVYAFGLILVELIARRRAVQSTRLFQILNEIQSGTVRRTAVKLVPASLIPIVDLLLADDPGDRPPMTEVINRLRHAEFRTSE